MSFNFQAFLHVSLSRVVGEKQIVVCQSQPECYLVAHSRWPLSSTLQFTFHNLPLFSVAIKRIVNGWLERERHRTSAAKERLIGKRFNFSHPRDTFVLLHQIRLEMLQVYWIQLKSLSRFCQSAKFIMEMLKSLLKFSFMLKSLLNFVKFCQEKKKLADLQKQSKFEDFIFHALTFLSCRVSALNHLTFYNFLFLICGFGLWRCLMWQKKVKTLRWK